MRIHLRENHTVDATVVRQNGKMLGVQFELADSEERERILLWVYSISVGSVQAPPSPARLALRFAARCLK